MSLCRHAAPRALLLAASRLGPQLRPCPDGRARPCPLPCSGDAILAFKAGGAGTFTASRAKKNGTAQAKALDVGAFTFWKGYSDTGIGSPVNAPTGTNTVTACLTACVADPTCAAVSMSAAGGGAVSTITDATTSQITCKLLQGAMSSTKRGLTKAVAAQLAF